MTCGTFTRTKVSADDVQLVVRAYQRNDPKPTSVTATEDGTGTYTVVAVWPPCEANISHSVAGST